MNTPLLFIASLVLLFLISKGLFLLPNYMQKRREKRTKRNIHEMPCPACQHVLFIHFESLRPMVSSERALIIGEHPEYSIEATFAESRCDFCQSALVFRTDTKPPSYITKDIAEPKHRKNDCGECQKPLIRPTWPEDAYENASQIMNIPSKVGLECIHCASITCVGCLETNTRKRTNDDSFLCPRCFRGPVETIHYF